MSCHAPCPSQFNGGKHGPIVSGRHSPTTQCITVDGNLVSVQQASLLFEQHLPPWVEGIASIERPIAAVTGEPLVADRDYPSIHRVMMDGICISWEAYQNGLREFKVAGICAAGAPIQYLSAHDTCLEIMTGAPLPEGAGLVIPYEHLKIHNGVAMVLEDLPRARFENVHMRGSDCGKNTPILETKRPLTGPRWGIAASFGYREVKCLKPPEIKIVSTGDELVEVGQKPEPHQIRRSNAYALKAALLQHGFEKVDLDHVRDDFDSLKVHYSQNKGRYDVLLYSGGVSKGKFDYLPRVWSEMGVERHFHEVSQRPGKPLWFGTDKKSHTAVIGLPGNPISSLVCLHRYFIRRRSIYARLAERIVFEKNLTLFAPVKINFLEDGVVSAVPLKVKNSGEFTALAESDGFLELPLEKSVFEKGESFRCFTWGPL
jgi:molybdopterin molybdotransferase